MTKQDMEQLITEYGKDIYSFCLSLTGNRDAADDLYQDTFLVMVEKSEILDCEQNIKSYLLSVAIRLWKNKRRKIAWRNRIAPVTSMEEVTFSAADNNVSASPEQEAVLKDELLYVRKQVAQLPEKYKTVLLLHYMEKQSVGEMAKQLRIPEGTVMSRLHKARRLLAERIE